MSKTVNFDKSNFNIDWSKDSCGLLIGNKQGQNINVFLPIECPTENSPNSEENNSSFSLNPKWIGQHALNVFRMLPGNATIIGCYVVSEEMQFPKNSNIFQSILSDIFCKEVKLNYDLFDDCDGGKIFLLINPTNSRFTCKKIDLSEEKCSFKKIDTVRYVDVFEEYRCAQSNIIVRIDVVMPSERDKELILRQLKESVHPFVTNFISKSVMLVNGQHLSEGTEIGSQIIDKPSEKSISRDSIGRGDTDDFAMTFTNGAASLKLDLSFIGLNMTPTTDSSVDSESENDFEMINRVRIHGRIPGIAFMSTRATIEDVETALKKDLTRSLYSRLELLTEELHITSGEMEVSQMLLPQRVKVSLPCCPTFPLSDYKFFSETATDVISRVRYFCRPPGMSDDELDINCVDMGIEKSEQASLDDELSEVELLPDEQKDQISQSINQSNGIVYFVGLSALVFFISIMIYYILY